MVKQVILNAAIRSEKPSSLKRELKKRIQVRVDCPIDPGCWLLIDESDQGLLSLDNRFFEKDPQAVKPRRGQHVTIRQALFQLVFKQLPPVGRIIKMKCENPGRCVAPHHFDISGWSMPSEAKQKMVDLNWMTIEEQTRGREFSSWYKRKAGLE